MRKKLMFLFFLLLVFVLSGPVPALAESTQSQNILILNSYYSGFAWTDDQVNGMLSSFYEVKGNYQISVEYLDWKRFPTEQNRNYFYEYMKMKYAQENIGIILCTDDAAFKFALDHREELFSNAPIVFSGVNSEGLHQIGNTHNNYTGVMEEIDPEGTIRAALTINSEIDTIYLIYDNSESGISTGKLCKEAALKVDNSLKVVPLNNYNNKEIINQIKKVNRNSMVLVTTYFMDSTGTVINHEQFCDSLSQASKVPIYHLYDFALYNGILGGNLIVGKLQGEEAGKIAIRILNGEKADSIPTIRTQTNQLIFNYSMLKRFDITQNSLPKNSHIINAPFSFIKTYKTLVITISIIFALLISFTITLIFYIHKIKKMQKKLTENNEELTQLYEELSASEEELRAQYQEIASANEKLEEYSSMLYFRAHHDTLTNLYNRLYLNEEIEKLLDKKSGKCALYFIDLDNFKYVNDSLGHNVGDELLKAISKRLSSLRSKNSTLIRLGGDEFVFFTCDTKDRIIAEDFANKILEVFLKPFRIRGNRLAITVSIGIAMFPDDGEDIDTLLRNADMAMYKVKNLGKKGYYFFNNILKEEFLERINIEKYFEKALVKNEFELYYQPQININPVAMNGFESLIRWNSPELGLLSPLKFISIAEETGFIVALGEWILRTSCLYIKELNEKFHSAYKISVNISVIQLLQDDFTEMVKRILDECGIESRLLELEITESVIMESADVITKKIMELRNMGILIALDDFGTGYSSLSYMKNMPITTIKIDKLFVDDIENANADHNVTDAIIELGHKLNLKIIAEGVETKAQQKYLLENGCDIIQGYLYSKPLPTKELEKWIQNFNC